MSNRRVTQWAAGALGLFLALSFGPRVGAHPPDRQPIKSIEKDRPTMQHAAGTFAVKLAPQPPDGAAAEPVLGRMSIDKTFKGDLEGTSQGQMLAITTTVKDSAGYVAMERVTGSLHGKKGSFALQHSGTMNRGLPTLSVTVVPDSGNGELVGIEGRMTIDISGGQHKYTFDYALPEGR